MKNVWVLNQYIADPRLGRFGRHYQISKELCKKYNIKLIGGSYLTFYKKNILKFPILGKTENLDKINFQFIKTIKYSGNGIGRYLSMIQFMINSILVNFFVKRTNKPDIIVASSVHPLTWISGYILKKIHKSKFIVETRDLWPKTLIDMKAIKEKSFVAKILYRLEKYMYTKADHLIFTMPGGFEYCKKYNIPPDKVSYINNGINVEEYDAFKKKYPFNIKVNKDFFNVFYTGTISHYNGVEYLIEAAEIIKKENLSINFYVVGDGLLLNKVMDRTQELGLNSIKFIGNVNKNNIPSILENSDLNLLLGVKIDLNKYGLSPNKLFDYFASGKPIISNRTTDFDIVVQEKAGISVDDESPEKLAEGIIYFYNLKLNDIANYNAICNNSRSAAYNYDYRVLSKKFEEIFERNLQ